jgi:hypothetical protein
MAVKRIFFFSERELVPAGTVLGSVIRFFSNFFANDQRRYPSW